MDAVCGPSIIIVWIQIKETMDLGNSLLSNTEPLHFALQARLVHLQFLNKAGPAATPMYVLIQLVLSLSSLLLELIPSTVCKPRQGIERQ